MEEIISVIIPVYQVENYIIDCIESVRRQTYSNLDIILVDDGSPDGCPGICDSYAELDPRIRVIHKKNGGLSDARNCGIEAAKGKYIVFVDSDDFIHPGMVDSLYQFLYSSGADIALCGIQTVDEKGENPKDLEQEVEEEIWGYEEFWNHYFGNNHVTCVVAWNKIYHRKIFEQIRYPVGKLHEDQFIIAELIQKNTKISIVKERLYCYRQRSDSITGVHFNIGKLDGVEALLHSSKEMYQCNRFDYVQKMMQSALGIFLNAMISLDLSDENVNKRFYGLKEQYIRQYHLLQGRKLSLKFILRSELFLKNEKLYLMIGKMRRFLKYKRR